MKGVPYRAEIEQNLTKSSKIQNHCSALREKAEDGLVMICG